MKSRVPLAHLKAIKFLELPPLIDWSAFPRLESIAASMVRCKRPGSVPVDDAVAGYPVKSAAALRDLASYPLRLRRLRKTFPNFHIIPTLKSITIIYCATMWYNDGTPDLHAVRTFLSPKEEFPLTVQQAAVCVVDKTNVEHLWNQGITDRQVRDTLRWKVTWLAPVPPSQGPSNDSMSVSGGADDSLGSFANDTAIGDRRSVTTMGSRNVQERH